MESYSHTTLIRCLHRYEICAEQKIPKSQISRKKLANILHENFGGNLTFNLTICSVFNNRLNPVHPESKTKERKVLT